MSRPPAPHRPRPPLLPLAAAVVAALAPDAAGSIVRALSLTQLVEQSDSVVLATVESASSAWLDGRIVTDSVVVVGEGLAGAAGGERMVVRTLGGEVDGIGQKVFGEPQLRWGERYLLFLEEYPAGGGPSSAIFRAVGMSQGALPVVDGPGGARVVPNPDLPELVEPGVEMSVGPWLDVPRPLEDVLTEVRAAVDEAGN
ncbi:MAG: hypothetical protein HY907_14225 [Deltaproteobacteria bacterium]|nr:hypothetical protein [Deltaproteobacteria bacterium]